MESLCVCGPGWKGFFYFAPNFTIKKHYEIESEERRSRNERKEKEEWSPLLGRLSQP